MVQLNCLKPGQSGWIERIEGDSRVSQRLMAMGLLPGAAVEVVRVAPLGDPIAVRLAESQISLRRREAAALFVRTDRVGPPAGGEGPC